MTDLATDFPFADPDQLTAIQGVIDKWRGTVDINDEDAVEKIVQDFSEVGTSAMHDPMTVVGLDENSKAFSNAIEQEGRDNNDLFIAYVLTGDFDHQFW